MLLPHAQVSGGDHDSNMSLERRLQTLLGAVSSHWPSFEPMLHRVANRIGSTMQQSHAVGVPLDQGQMSLQTSMGLVRDRPPEAYRPHELSGGGRRHLELQCLCLRRSLQSSTHQRKAGGTWKFQRFKPILCQEAGITPEPAPAARDGEAAQLHTDYRRGKFSSLTSPFRSTNLSARVSFVSVPERPNLTEACRLYSTILTVRTRVHATYATA